MSSGSIRLSSKDILSLSMSVVSGLTGLSRITTSGGESLDAIFAVAEQALETSSENATGKASLDYVTATTSLLQSATDSLGGRVTTVEGGKRAKEHSYTRLEVNELLAGRLSTEQAEGLDDRLDGHDNLLTAHGTRLDTAEASLLTRASQTAVSDLTTTVGTKAPQSSLDTLTLAVGAKAAQSSLDTLTSTVNDKAAQSALDQVSNTLTSVQTTLQAGIDSRHPILTVNAPLAQTLVSGLAASLGAKADASTVSALQTEVAGKAANVSLIAAETRLTAVESDVAAQSISAGALTVRVSTLEGAYTDSEVDAFLLLKAPSTTTDDHESRLAAAESALGATAAAGDSYTIAQANALLLGKTATSATTALQQRVTVVEQTQATRAAAGDSYLRSEADTLLANKASLSQLTALTTIVVDNSAAIHQKAGLNRLITAEDLIATKHDAISADAPLPQSHVDGLVTVLASKQPTVVDDALQISHVTGLQAAIDAAGSNVGSVGDVPGLQTALNLKANASTAYTRTHIDANFQTLASAAGHATATTAAFSQVASDVAALNTEISLRSYADVTYTRTETNALLGGKLDTTDHATSVSNLQTQQTTNQSFTDARFAVLDGGHADPDLASERGRVGLLEDRMTAAEAADNTSTVTQLQTDIDAAEVLIGQVSNTVNSKQPTLLRPLFPTSAVELVNDSSQVKRLLGSGGVDISVAQHQEGGFSYEYANIALDGTHQNLPNRMTALEAVSSQAAITRPVLPSGSTELLTADSLLKRVLGSDGILTQDAFHITSDGTTPFLAIKLDTATLARLTSLEAAIVTRTNLHNSLQGEVTNGQGAQNTKLDVLEILADTSTQNNASQFVMINSLDTRLDAQERRYVTKLGPYSTGTSGTGYTSYTQGDDTYYNITVTVPFPSGRFNAAPMVFVNQSASGNSSGHSSIARCWTTSCSATSCNVVISDTFSSNNVYIDLLALQP